MIFMMFSFHQHIDQSSFVCVKCIPFHMDQYQCCLYTDDLHHIYTVHFIQCIQVLSAAIAKLL